MKKLLVFLVSVLTMALLLTGCGGDTEKKDAAAGGEQQVLNLFSWADNFDPEVIAEFEKQYNCKVNYDVFAKIQCAEGCYDRKIASSDHGDQKRNDVRPGEGRGQRRHLSECICELFHFG